jgi:hypothetical protein
LSHFQSIHSLKESINNNNQVDKLQHLILIRIKQIPDHGAHIPLPSIHTNKERDDLKGDTFEDIFKPHMEGTKLSKIGKLQVRLNCAENERIRKKRTYKQNFLY